MNALRPDSIFEAAVKRLGILRRPGDRIAIVDGLPSPYINLPDSWPEYLGTMKVKDRRNQTRYFRKLTAKYGERVHIGEAKERNKVMEIMAELKRLHTLSWAARNIEGVFSDERFYRFHVHVALDYLVRGWVSLFYVEIDDKVVGVLYCFKHKQCMYAYQHGYDPAFSSYALGRVMVGHAIRSSIESGLELFDFLRGGEKYKYFWTRKERIDRNVIIDNGRKSSKL
ncbi:GNAT family N-acetyltransferase [Gammaproteobacteria bacterium]|nr:GNAT family N-acetyltransferase [Gammaproteobacteria bacterium]